MKNRIIILALIFTSLQICGQNIFPENGDVLLRGNSIKIERPETSGGWARGTFFYQFKDIENRLAGYGLLGTADKPSLLYLAHGKSPWASGLGVYVNTKGYVGVGTTKPEEMLHVNGSVRGNLTSGALKIRTQSGYLDIGPQNTGYAHIYTDRPKIILNKDVYTTTGGFSSYNTLDLFLKTNGISRLIVKKATGNIGVGTTTPVATAETASPETRLHIKANNSTGDVEVARFEGGNDVDNTAAVVRINHSNDRGLYLKGGRRLGDQSFAELGIIGTAGNFESPSIAFNDMGNVGIGTIEPDEKLTVKGKIHTQEVRVDLDGVIAPDYVFEKYYLGTSSLKRDYVMPTLKELEAFTKVNHHLPEIPSSKEMQENGIQLKEINLKLLQKIEELTLYTIQQENKIQSQEEKNRSLESRLEKIEAFIKSAKN